MKDKQETKPAGVYKKKGAAESVKQEIKDLERIYNKKIQDIEELKKAVLKKSFSGELTK